MITNAEYELQRILNSRAFRSEVRGRDRREHIAYAIERVVVDGLWLEFGVSTGASLDCITSQTDQMVYGFDSFEGLPEDWVLGDGYLTWEKGSFQGRPASTRQNATLITGLFQDTLPGFLNAHAGPAAFVHVDCDLYSSASYVLQTLKHRFIAGTVIVFDELFNYPNYADHEMRALVELVATTGLEYEYLGHVPEKTPASLQITRIRANAG